VSLEWSSGDMNEVHKFPSSSRRKLKALRDREPPVSTLNLQELHEILVYTNRYDLIRKVWPEHAHSHLVMQSSEKGQPLLTLTFHRERPTS